MKYDSYKINNGNDYLECIKFIRFDRVKQNYRLRCFSIYTRKKKDRKIRFILHWNLFLEVSILFECRQFFLMRSWRLETKLWKTFLNSIGQIISTVSSSIHGCKCLSLVKGIKIPASSSKFGVISWFVFNGNVDIGQFLMNISVLTHRDQLVFGTSFISTFWYFLWTCNFVRTSCLQRDRSRMAQKWCQYKTCSFSSKHKEIRH